MKTKALKKEPVLEKYYDTHRVLRDIIDEDIDLSLDDVLRKKITDKQNVYLLLTLKRRFRYGF